jgi:hypothetical protein
MDNAARGSIRLCACSPGMLRSTNPFVTVKNRTEPGASAFRTRQVIGSLAMGGSGPTIQLSRSISQLSIAAKLTHNR